MAGQGSAEVYRYSHHSNAKYTLNVPNIFIFFKLLIINNINNNMFRNYGMYIFGVVVNMNGTRLCSVSCVYK